MNPKLLELIEGLLEGTRRGTFRWDTTPEKGVYRLMLNKGLVRIYHVGPLSAGDNFIGCTVLNEEGSILHDVQTPRRDGGCLVALYDIVDGGFQEDALDDLLNEVRSRVPLTAS